MADGSSPLLATLRFALFAALAIAGPGVGLQRLARVRCDPALVLPLGLTFCALGYWLSLVLAFPLLFPLLTALGLLTLTLPGEKGRAEGPSLRGALPAITLLLALFALTQYGVNRVDRSGAFLLDRGEHVDTALHVGVSFELVAGYPPQVPGLAGVPMHYHVGSHLVRAAASRWAGIHPYDAMSRFDITLWAIALVLALRAAARAAGLGGGAVAAAGFVPLLSDLSFLPGLHSEVQFWASKLGDNFLEPLFFANSITPALAMALAATVALARARRGEGRGHLALAAALAAGTGFFKVFTGAQLLLCLAIAWALGRGRRALLLAGAPAAAALVVLALRSASPAGAAGVSASLVPFAPLGPALVAFGFPPAHGAAYLGLGLLWVLLSLGLRLLGVPAAVRALRDGGTASAVLASLALCGWPLATFLSITADPDFDESFYFLQTSGVVLWLFALPALARLVRRPLLVALSVALLALPSSVEFLGRKASQAPEAIDAAAVRAMAALRRASCPGDVVITRPLPLRQWVPLPVVLAGRRVAYSNYLGYWRQFVSTEALAERDRLVRSFFRSTEPAHAVSVAAALGARYAYLSGRQALDFDTKGVLEPVFASGGERVYRIVGAAGPACAGATAAANDQPAP